METTTIQMTRTHPVIQRILHLTFKTYIHTIK